MFTHLTWKVVKITISHLIIAALHMNLLIMHNDFWKFLIRYKVTWWIFDVQNILSKHQYITNAYKIQVQIISRPLFLGHICCYTYHITLSLLQHLVLKPKRLPHWTLIQGGDTLSAAWSKTVLFACHQTAYSCKMLLNSYNHPDCLHDKI